MVALLTVIISGCWMNNGIPITRPDLIPVCLVDPVNYCDIDAENYILFVHIKNVGLADAEVSHAQVIFYYITGENNSQIKPIPPIPAGETITISFDATLGSGDSNLDFEIMVDIYNEINETNEKNNKVSGICAN
jgi:subtilase family serine protease